MGRQIKPAFPLDRAAFVAYIFSVKFAFGQFNSTRILGKPGVASTGFFRVVVALLVTDGALSSVTPLNDAVPLFTGPISRANAHSFQRN